MSPKRANGGSITSSSRAHREPMPPRFAWAGRAVTCDGPVKRLTTLPACGVPRAKDAS